MLRDGLDPAVELERRRLMALAAADATFQAKTEEWLDDKRPLWSAANAFLYGQRVGSC